MITDSIKRILVPTDLSDFGKIALHYAETFQDKLGASVTAMFANEPLPVGFEFPGGYFPLSSVELDQRFRKELLDHVAETVSNPERFETLVVDERAVAAIVTTADRISADLIIMGTHGRSGWRRAFLGSVAERVLHMTSRPVLTVTPPAAAAKKTLTIKSVLCPVNLTAVSHDALLEAAQVAKAFGAELIVMHVVEKDPPFYAAFEIEKWVPPAIREHTHFRYLAVKGNAAERILETADSSAIDLIVIAAQHKRFSDTTVVGETTERITRFARQPVLTVVRKEQSEKEGKLTAA